MKTLKKVLILILLLFAYIFIASINYVHAISSNISNEVFRLHVIANSNSLEDQNLKYHVRDAVIQYVKTLSENVNSKNDIIDIVNNNRENIKVVAENTVKTHGFEYPVNINIGNFAFPTKNYGDISLPSGFYDALKIEIGNATGQNWWCVMFPPLCFVDITSGIVPESSKTTLEEKLDDEEYAIISEKNNTIKFKFKLIEMFENIGISLGYNDSKKENHTY